MRLRLVKEPFDYPDYIFELKMDGFRAMRFLIVIDSAKNGRRTRSYLCCPPEFPKNGWAWTFQREEATEFGSRKEAQRIIETIMRLKSGVLIVPVSEDPQPAAGS